jgi:hypothetical protein
MKVSRLALLLGSLAFVGEAAGQIITIKRLGDRSIVCKHSGIWLNPADCGFRSDRYTDVFVGKVSAVNPVGHDEQQIQIIPQEVFAGKPGKRMTVVTSQGLCLPKLLPGEQWLFFLRREESKPVVLNYYWNDSLPLSEADEQVAILRHLKSLKHSGILRGHVSTATDGKPIPNASVFARRSKGRQFATTTDVDGRYEFEPLRPGKYSVSTEPIRAYQSGIVEFEIDSKSCWNLELSTRSDAAP